MRNNDRGDVVDEARRWIATPYHHQGRRRGASCDCIGLIIGVARGLRFRCPPDRDLPKYSPWPHEHIAERTATMLLTVARGAEPMPGQIGLFWFRQRGHGQHFCIFGDHGGRQTMIHAYIHSGSVVEAGANEFWRRRLMRVYDYREVADANS